MRSGPRLSVCVLAAVAVASWAPSAQADAGGRRLMASLGYFALTDPIDESGGGFSLKTKGGPQLVLEYAVNQSDRQIGSVALSGGRYQFEVSDGVDKATTDLDVVSVMYNGRYFLGRTGRTGVFLKGGLGVCRLSAGDVRLNGQTVGRFDEQSTGFAWQIGGGFAAERLFGELTYHNGGKRGNTLYSFALGGRF